MNTAYDTLIKFVDFDTIYDLLHDNEELTFTDKKIKLHSRIPLAEHGTYYAVIVDLEDHQTRHIFILDVATEENYFDVKEKNEALVDAIKHTYNVVVFENHLY